jgi:class 3 adenylate cyclase/predicted ATPase
MKATLPSDPLGAEESKSGIGALSDDRAERRQITVMFCDLVGSTELSTRLDPEDLREVVRVYQSACRDVIAGLGGFIAQYLGDGILAYFGYPDSQEGDALQGVRAGLAIVATVQGQIVNGTPLGVRVGIATGLTVVGDLIGSGSASHPAITGLSPNLAARMQSLAPAGGLVVSDSTYRLLRDAFVCEDLGAQRVKGIAEPTRAWLVLRERTAAERVASQHSHFTPFVGRDRELDLLLGSWRLAAQGVGRAWAITGEAGIGKSRLAGRLIDQLVPAGRVLLLQGSQQHRDTPFYPIVTELQRAAGIRPEDSSDAKLDRIEALLSLTGHGHSAPLLASLLHVPFAGRYSPLSLAPGEQRLLTLKLLVDHALGLAAERAVLLLVEDVHWLDASTEEVLGLLMERLASCRMMLLMTTRPDHRSHLLDHPEAMNITLGRLSPHEGAALIGGLLGSKHLPQAVMDRVLETSDGVPLFLEELTKTTVESGLLRDEGGAYVLETPLPGLAIPSTLRDSLMARLDRLANAKAVAQVGAAIGRSFSFALLSAVSDEDETTLKAALARLSEARLVYVRKEPGDVVYVFKHALVRDTAYESMLRKKRVALHARIVEALETRFPQTVEEEPELLAQHCGFAMQIDKAIKYWLASGHQAISRSANVEAINRLGNGLALITSSSSQGEYAQLELDLQLALGQASIAAHGYTAATTRAAFNRAEELAQAIDNRDRQYPALYGIFVGHLIGGKIDLAAATIERLRKIAEADADRAHLSVAYRLLGSLSFFRGDIEIAKKQLRRCLDLCGSEERKLLSLRFGPDTTTAAEIFLALSEWLAGAPDTAIATAEAAVADALQLDHALTIAQIIALAAQLRFMARDYSALDELSRQGTDYCTKSGIVYFGAICRLHKIRGEAERVGSAKCLSEFQRELASYEALNGLEVGYFRAMLAEMLLAAQRPQEAADEARTAIEQMLASGERWWLPEAHRVRGEALLAMSNDDRAGAELSFLSAIEEARRLGAKALELRVAVSLARLRKERSDPKWSAMLAGIYRQFPLEVDTADLRVARNLLQ